MGAFLNWDRNEHFAVDHGVSGIARKTVQYCSGSADIGFLSYPTGELFCRFLNYDAAAFRKLKQQRDGRQTIPASSIAQMLACMPYYEALMDNLPEEKQQSTALLFSQYQRGFLWQDAEDCFRLIEKHYSKLAFQFLCTENAAQPAVTALQNLSVEALNSPALGDALRTAGLPQVQYVIAGTKDSPALAERYQVTKLSELLYLDMIHLLRDGGSIRKCSCCGRYFVPERGYNYRYCSNIVPGETRSCREIGAARTRQNKLDNSGILTEYQRAYKRYYARVLKAHWTKEQFHLWQEEALRLREEASAADMQPKEFAELLQKAADRPLQL